MMKTKIPYTDCDDAVIAWLVEEALRPGSRFHADLFADGAADDHQDECELEDVSTLLDRILGRARDVA